MPPNVRVALSPVAVSRLINRLLRERGITERSLSRYAGLNGNHLGLLRSRGANPVQLLALRAIAADLGPLPEETEKGQWQEGN